jgi:hypothetical protein
MRLLLEWVLAFPPGERQRVDDAREYMVAAARGALLSAGVGDASFAALAQAARQVAAAATK